jgi:hypothetical protein
MGIATLLVIAASAAFVVRTAQCIDGCGPYHNAASAADLDGDGDLDVVLSNLRHETETIYWAGPTLWINQGEGKFTARRVDFGGPYTAAGDVDGDGDADILQLEYAQLALYLNQGGVQGGQVGELRIWHTVKSGLTASPGSHGSVGLGDLNSDGRLDAFVSGCCGVLQKDEHGKVTYAPSTSWVWINTPDDQGRPVGQTAGLEALGDLPMRAALGDLDGDGDLDVFAAIQPPKAGGEYVPADRVLLNDGSGNFTDSGQRLEAGDAAITAGSTAAALGDLDDDGDLDALVGRTNGARVWTNQGGAQGGQAGAFAGSGQPMPGGRAEAVFLTDLDGDGDLDAVLAEKAQASIWWNDGQAAFSDSGQRLRYTERHGLAVADFNGDGYADVFSSAYDQEFHLWLNAGDGTLVKEK